MDVDFLWVYLVGEVFGCWGVGECGFGYVVGW